MSERSKVEELLTTILNLFASQFSNSAILRGGMVLRLLDSPRLTNDLDYIFVPHRSKNEIVAKILESLLTIPDVTVKHSLNSKCVRCIVQQRGTVVQIEATVGTECEVEVLSTASLSKRYNQTPRIVSVMAFDMALAHKLAAWYERRLVRDLFDVHLFVTMGIAPNIKILERRLKQGTKPKGSRQKLKSVSIAEFLEILQSAVRDLSAESVREELGSILPSEELLGLDLKIKNSILNRLRIG